MGIPGRNKSHTSRMSDSHKVSNRNTRSGQRNPKGRDHLGPSAQMIGLITGLNMSRETFQDKIGLSTKRMGGIALPHTRRKISHDHLGPSTKMIGHMPLDQAIREGPELENQLGTPLWKTSKR